MSSQYSWVKEVFNDENFYVPFVVEKDIDYYDDLKRKYELFFQKAEKASADRKSLAIIKTDTEKVLLALDSYYCGKIPEAHSIVNGLIKSCQQMGAPTGIKNILKHETRKVEFFRARTSHKFENFKPKDMLHLPKHMRGKTGNYRFSIPGTACLYLGNTSYVCWLETGQPSDHDFYVSPVIVDDELKIFNLAILTSDFFSNDGDVNEDDIYWKLKAFILMIATSYQIKEEGRTFKSEYVISQCIMLICKNLGYNGILYYSKRIDGECFKYCAFNLALIAPYDGGDDSGEYSSICKHIKIDHACNYEMYKKMKQTNSRYKLYLDKDCLLGGFKNVGNKAYHCDYTDSSFYKFDKYLFDSWYHKNEIEFGNAIAGTK